MALWLDDGQRIQEADEGNNVSWGWEPIQFGPLHVNQQPMAAAISANARRSGQVLAGVSGERSQHNGRRRGLTLNRSAQKSAHTIAAVKINSSNAEGPHYGREPLIPSKHNQARNPRIFPVGQVRVMPRLEED